MRMTLRYFPHLAAAGAAALGGSTTECSTPGNVQINATPSEPTYVYPWDDEFYGPALIIAPGGGGGGGHGGGGREHVTLGR
jgi:hypothetical protein